MTTPLIQPHHRFLYHITGPYTTSDSYAMTNMQEVLYFYCLPYIMLTGKAVSGPKHHESIYHITQLSYDQMQGVLYFYCLPHIKLTGKIILNQSVQKTTTNNNQNINQSIAIRVSLRHKIVFTSGIKTLSIYTIMWVVKPPIPTYAEVLKFILSLQQKIISLYVFSSST